MNFLTYDGEIELDIHGIIMDIDKIFHEKITQTTGTIIPHAETQKFISDIIRKHNKEIQQMRREMEKEKREMEEQ